MDDGIRALLEAHPAALESMDIDPKLYPRILAVVGQPKETKKKIGRRGASAIRRLRKKSALVERNIPTALFEVGCVSFFFNYARSSSPLMTAVRTNHFRRSFYCTDVTG